MNSYRIDTFKLDSGEWKAVAYECGRYISEAVGINEARVVIEVSHHIATDIWNKLGLDD